MASAARSLQLGVRRCCAAATIGSTSSTPRAAASAPTRTRLPVVATGQIRCLSNTVRRSAAGDASGGGSSREALEDWEVEMMAKENAGERMTSLTDAMRDLLPASERHQIPPATQKEREREERLLSETRRGLAEDRRVERTFRGMFWNDEESDPEMLTRDGPEDEFVGDDISSMAHGKLEEIRERRHYARIAAWEMPLLSKFAKPFEPPAADMPLRFRFTSYMGEFHPAEKKVVVEFCPADLGLTEVQQGKLKKLAGVRYNPETEIIRMSCEMYEHQAQNKRYLGDLVERLIAEAKDPKDTFEDIPLDTRHHTFKQKPKFPKEWRMTEERRKELQDIRAQAFLLDQKRTAEGTLVDGVQRVQMSLGVPAQDKASGKVPELVGVRQAGGRTPLSR